MNGFPPMEKAHDLIGVIETQWKALHLLVVGDVMLDKYVWGEVSRISPEAPIPIVKALRSSEQPGGAANVAFNAAALGARVTLVGVVGDDQDGRRLRLALQDALLGGAAIEYAMPVDRSRPTTAKTRILSASQQMLRMDVEATEDLLPEVEEEVLTAVATRIQQRPSVIVLSDYAKGVLTERVCATVVAWAAAENIPVIIDPKRADFSRYRGAALVCPNLAELATATGISLQDMEAVLTAGEALAEALSFASLAVTLSERGVALLEGGTKLQAPARAQQVFDVSGAGDTVTAVLALCWASHIDRMASIQLANMAAGIVVGKVGTAPVHAHELIAALAREASESGGKTLGLAAMATRIRAWRAAGERVVFTNGCFDLLHAGHVTLLEEARRQGDRLVVGLNSDASIRALKGSTRPLYGEEHRARLLAALSAVDGVMIFSEETPLKTIVALHPDVLVKGSDYAEEAVVGAAEVRAWGGKLVLVPLIPGLSTTRTLARALACSA